MFRRELGIWRRLNHPNVVPFLGIAYGFGMDGAMSLVSLWMSHGTLQNFLEVHADKLGVVHRLHFLLDIANGLQYLHSLSIVHGDLNCNNVLLDTDYTARLGDFGYASLVGNIPEALTYLCRSTARPGALRWIAPEQIDFENTFSRTTKSDIYSFGCVGLQGAGFILIFLQVFSGKQPWSEVREDAAVVLRISKGYKPGRPASRFVDDLYWTLMERCWSSIEERPDAEAIITSVKWFLASYTPFQPLCDIMIMSDKSSLTGPSPNANDVDVIMEPLELDLEDANAMVIDAELAGEQARLSCTRDGGQVNPATTSSKPIVANQMTGVDPSTPSTKRPSLDNEDHLPHSFRPIPRQKIGAASSSKRADPHLPLRLSSDLQATPE
ncbi:kinase-like domain-containing protein [Boletus coccyginus]|nr:kinase-like domain-containing protein [Boletus coccyginus]